MHFAIRRFLILGGTAAALLAATPSATEAAATAERPDPATGPNDGPALIHVVRSGDTLHRLSIAYREQAGWYSQSDCLAAIRRANDLPDERALRIGRSLTIPRHRPPDPPRVRRPTRDGSDMRGIYLPAYQCADERLFARVDSFVARGGNGVVLDAKDIDGAVSYRSTQPLAGWGPGRTAPPIGDLADLVRRLHARDLWVAARLALFLDGDLGGRRPDLALPGPDGQPWRERGCIWLDPTDPQVRDHNLGLAVELARLGVDEVQIDYVRFPTNGWHGDASGDPRATAQRRRQVVTSFVAALHDTLQTLDCLLSADLYGIMAWDRLEDLALTGQHVPSLARHLDIICPMIYPSHFAPGFEGLDRPGDNPQLLIAAGVDRFRDLAGDGVLVRPWLQAFPWRVTAYDAGYVGRQIAAANAAGADGWCLWNPSGRYDVALEALRCPSYELAVAAAGSADPSPAVPATPVP